MIKAGCPKQICKKCGKPRERIVKIEVDLGKRYKDKTAEEIKAIFLTLSEHKHWLICICKSVFSR